MTAREDQQRKLCDCSCHKDGGTYCGGACAANHLDLPAQQTEDQPRPTPPTCEKCGKPKTEMRYITGKGTSAPSGRYRCWTCATKEAEENWTPADNPSQIMCVPVEAQGEAPQVGTCDFSKVPHERHKFCNEFTESGQMGGQTIGQNADKFLHSAKLAMTNEVTMGAHPSQDALAERIGYKIQSLLTDKYTNSLKIAVGIIAQELGARARSTPSLPAQDAAYWIVEWRFPAFKGRTFEWQPVDRSPFLTEQSANSYPARRDGYYEYRISKFTRGGSTPSPDPCLNCANLETALAEARADRNKWEDLASPTIADAERFIRKMEACENMPAKLILLQYFVKRAAPDPKGE